MQDYAKALLAGKKLCVMSEKQFSKLNGKYEKTNVELSNSGKTVVLRCRRSVSTNKLYILPDEYEKIPPEIKIRLNIKDVRTDTERPSSNVWIFNSVLDFNKYSVVVVSHSAMKVLCAKGGGYSLKIYIADINKEIGGYYIRAENKILIQQSDFDSFSLSTKFRFSLVPTGGGCFSVREVLPVDKQSQEYHSTGNRKKTRALATQRPHSQNRKKLKIWLVSQVVIDYWIRIGQVYSHTIEMKFRHKGYHRITCVRNPHTSMLYISKEGYCDLPPRAQAMLDCDRYDERALIDKIAKMEHTEEVGRGSIAQMDQQKRGYTIASKVQPKIFYFSEKFVGSIERQNERIWNTWLQSKQIFVFEDAFAAQILSHADAAEEVQGEALIRCPFTTSYIIGKEEDGTKLEFFAVLDGNVLCFQQMQDEEADQSYELRIDQHWTGKQMLDAIGMPLLRDTAMKMLQLYSCLCSATLEQAHDIVARSEPLLPSGTTPKRDRSEKKEIPDWDVDIYTVTMRREIKKQRRRAKANDSTGPLVRRPHPRRAHWHHYWVGSRMDSESRRLVLKWIPEIVVNQKEDDLPVRIILVRSNRSVNTDN